MPPRKNPLKFTAVVFDSSHYKVLTNSDLTEGRGETVLLGRSFTQERAAEFAKGQGVMGTDAKVELVAEKLVAWDGALYVLVPAKMLSRESPAEIARRGCARARGGRIGSAMTLVIRKSSCSVPLRQEGTVVVARCGWPTYQEGTMAHCTRPDCIGYTPRARELQALAVQLDLTAAIEKLNTLLSASLSKLGE